MNSYSLPLLCILLAGNTALTAADRVKTHQKCDHKKELIDEVSLDESKIAVSGDVLTLAKASTF